MGSGRKIRRIASKEHVGFVLTSVVSRHVLARFMGWFSRIEFTPVRWLSILIWKRLNRIDLADARTTSFPSLHHAITRGLRQGARRIDPDPALVTSPCDAVLGAFGQVKGGLALQIKGMPYPVVDLFGSAREAAHFEGGWYVTLRLTAAMYHRFHAPHDSIAEQLRYISGDIWNTHPIALERIDRLLCKNERAPIVLRIVDTPIRLVMVPIGSVLAASIRLPWVDGANPIRHGGQRTERFEHHFRKGQEMGWFEHGSTIVMFGPPETPPVEGLVEGGIIRVGQPIMRITGREPL